MSTIFTEQKPITTGSGTTDLPAGTSHEGPVPAIPAIQLAELNRSSTSPARKANAPMRLLPTPYPELDPPAPLQARKDDSSAPPAQADSPTTHDCQLLLERRSAQADGYELPLDLAEAAAYVGSSLNRVISLAFAGEIPAYPTAGGAWIFYVSELEEWLASETNKVATDPLPLTGRSS